MNFKIQREPYADRFAQLTTTQESHIRFARKTNKVERPNPENAIIQYGAISLLKSCGPDFLHTQYLFIK